MTLCDADVIAKDKARDPQIESSAASKALFEALCWVIDQIYVDRPIQRFYFLETVARVPYFSYVSVIHLFESFGWWRASELKKLHFAEEWNEMHHLLIMESLGGNSSAVDRAVAQDSHAPSHPL